MNSDRIDPRSLLAYKLYIAATSTAGRIVIGGLITTIAKCLDVEPDPKDRVSGSKRLDKATFEQIKFLKLEAGRLWWIYPWNRLCSFPMLSRPSYLTRLTFHSYLVMLILSFLHHLDVHLLSMESLVNPSSYSTDYQEVQATLRSIEEEQASLRAYVENEHATLHNIVQERYDEFCGIIACQIQYLHDFRACLETWRD